MVWTHTQKKLMVLTYRNKIGSSISLSVSDISFFSCCSIISNFYLFAYADVHTFFSAYIQILIGLQLLIAQHSLAAMQQSVQIYVFHA
jgi:hypothetical protein